MPQTAIGNRPRASVSGEPSAPKRSVQLTVSVPEAARRLGIGRSLAWELARDGTLPTLRLGRRRVLVPVAALDALVAGAGARTPNSSR